MSVHTSGEGDLVKEMFSICVLRFPGWTLSDVRDIPVSVLGYIAKQLKIDAREIQQYADREQTKHEHLDEIRREFGFRNFSIREYRVISQKVLHHGKYSLNHSGQ